MGGKVLASLNMGKSEHPWRIMDPNQAVELLTAELKRFYWALKQDGDIAAAQAAERLRTALHTVQPLLPSRTKTDETCFSLGQAGYLELVSSAIRVVEELKKLGRHKWPS